MALTLIEEIKIIKGRINPEVVSLNEIINQAAMGAAADIYPTLKVVDESTQPLAFSYKLKIISLIANILNSNDMYTEKIKRIIVSKLATTAVTGAQLIAATDSQWVTFFNDNMFYAIELLANILPEEKVDYDSIV